LVPVFLVSPSLHSYEFVFFLCVFFFFCFFFGFGFVGFCFFWWFFFFFFLPFFAGFGVCVLLFFFFVWVLFFFVWGVWFFFCVFWFGFFWFFCYTLRACLPTFFPMHANITVENFLCSRAHLSTFSDRCYLENSVPFSAEFGNRSFFAPLILSPIPVVKFTTGMDISGLMFY